MITGHSKSTASCSSKKLIPFAILLAISLLSGATARGQECSCDPSPGELCDGVTIQKVYYRMASTGELDVYADSDGHDVSNPGPEWQICRATNYGASYVCGQSGQDKTIKIKVDLQGPPNATGVNVQVPGKVAARTVNFDADGDAEAEFDVAVPLGNAINYVDEDWTWQYQLPGGVSYIDTNTTHNREYVVLDDPEPPSVDFQKAYETYLKIGTDGAKGASSADDALTKLYAYFNAHNVQDQTGHPLTAYKGNVLNGNGLALHAATLIALRNGNCVAWAELFRAVVLNNGVTKQVPVVADKIIPDPAALPAGKVTLIPTTDPQGLLMKPWAFNGNGTIANSKYPYKANPDTANPWEVNAGVSYVEAAWANQDVVDGGGRVIQNNNNGPNAYRFHAVLEINGQIYDPMNGAGPFANLLAWQNAMVDGYFALDNTVLVNNNLVNVQFGAFQDKNAANLDVKIWMHF